MNRSVQDIIVVVGDDPSVAQLDLGHIEWYVGY